MTAIADLSDLIDRSTGGSSGTPETVWFHKVARVAGSAPTAHIAGRPATLWRYDGQPGGGAAPTTAIIPDRTTTGALGQANPGGGRQKWMTQAFASGLVAGTLIVYDRLFQRGNFSGTTATAQTVQDDPASPALTRYTDGLGNLAFIEINTIIGTTTSAVTMSYRDQGDNLQSGTSVQIGNTGFREVDRVLFLPPAAGDTGVKSVVSVTHATTGTAGAYSVVIGHPLTYIGIGAAGSVGWRDFSTGLPGIPEIHTDACLAMLWIPTTTSAPELFGAISSVEA
jgi:hypothetical protein